MNSCMQTYEDTYYTYCVWESQYNYAFKKLSTKFWNVTRKLMKLLNSCQNYLNNDSDCDKIITHIFWIFVIPKLLCVLPYLYVMCSMQYVVSGNLLLSQKQNLFIIFITIINLLSR